MDKDGWVRYLNKASVRQLPKAFKFVKSNVTPEEYDEILRLANIREVEDVN